MAKMTKMTKTDGRVFWAEIVKVEEAPRGQAIVTIPSGEAIHVQESPDSLVRRKPRAKPPLVDTILRMVSEPAGATTSAMLRACRSNTADEIAAVLHELVETQKVTATRVGGAGRHAVVYRVPVLP